MQIPLKLPPKSCAHNACGIVRHSTLWVKPQLVAQIEFVEWTGDNHLRHSKFIGLRDDKEATDVRKES